jgi:RimJ/RimL family protein N-acetyltransferase
MFIESPISLKVLPMVHNAVLRKLHTAGRMLRSGELSELIRSLSGKLLTVETYLAYRIDLAGVPPQPANNLPLALRRAVDADFRSFRNLPAPFPRHAEFREKFGLDQCYIGTIDGEIAHLAWIYYPGESNRHPTRFRRFRSDEVAIANCVTLPRFRGKGVYPAVIRQLLPQLRSEGYRYCYMYIDVENLASRRGVEKVGFAPAGKSWRVRCFFHRDPASGIYLRGVCRRN